MREVSFKPLREPKGMSELTRHKKGARTIFMHFGVDSDRRDKPVPGFVVRISESHALTTPQGGVHGYAQDLAAALPRKHMHHMRLEHERVALIHVDFNELPKTEIDSLDEGTSAHVVQESMLVACAYERRVRKSVHVRVPVEPQQRPGPELPTRRVLMVHRRGASGRVHLLVVRRRIGGDLAFGRKVAG